MNYIVPLSSLSFLFVTPSSALPPFVFPFTPGPNAPPLSDGSKERFFCKQGFLFPTQIVLGSLDYSCVLLLCQSGFFLSRPDDEYAPFVEANFFFHWLEGIRRVSAGSFSPPFLLAVLNRARMDLFPRDMDAEASFLPFTITAEGASWDTTPSKSPFSPSPPSF